MTNSTALSQANFEYVSNNIQGSESVTYVLGIGGMTKETLVDNAKKDMLQRNPLKANQALCNLTVNMKTSYQLGLFITVTCTVTADVVEFITMNSNNGFSENRTESSTTLRNKKEEEHIPSELTNQVAHSSSDTLETVKSTDVNIPVISPPNTLETVNPSNKEFPDYIIFDNIKYSVGDDVVYTFNGKSAIIEEIIRDEYSRFFFKFKIKLKKNNKIKYASLDYIVRINL